MVLREDWREVREDVMRGCLRAKFADPALRAALLARLALLSAC